jgi:hypothetical protein
VVEKGRLRDWLAICSKNPTALKREMGGFQQASNSTRVKEADKYQTGKVQEKVQRKRNPEESPSRNQQARSSTPTRSRAAHLA